MVASSWMFFNTRAIERPIQRISSSFMPRVVTAGVPIRRPLVTNGLRLSFGMVFLLTVMWAFPSTVSASSPGARGW